MKKKKWHRRIGAFFAMLGIAFVGMSIIAKKKRAESRYDNAPEQKNPLEGKKVIFVENENDPVNADGAKGHLETIGESDRKAGVYETYIKRGIDVVLSFCGLVALSPLLLGIVIAIKIDDPGPAIFTQKRVGQNKRYFKLHKFRSMKMSTPKDKPTHMLENPDQYITRVGRFLRAHSLDELPQIWDIFIGNMSIIGPRPGLWNQDFLTAERDKYDANDVKPGLTGWAQINGRDELEIPDKARFDGEYVQNMGAIMDAKVFLGTIGVFAKDDSVVEGGTGKLKKKVERHYTDGKSSEELIGHIGFGEPVTVDETAQKKVLITGADSYIGEYFRAYAEAHYPTLVIDVVDMLDPAWREKDFSEYDVVYHVAGIAHADVTKVAVADQEKYYAVNTDLAVEVCEKAKAEGVKEFIFMSSMIVYGESAPYRVRRIVDEHTVPSAANFYGDSKLQADVAVRSLADENFKVIVLRPPMIYGRNSKGNYPALAKLAKKYPIFPDVNNERSMLHIDNLCELLCQVMLVKDIKENAVVLIPQNAEWTRTTDMVKEIAAVSGNKLKTLKIMRPAVFVGGMMPGKLGKVVNKAFGNMTYSHSVSEIEGIDYCKVDLRESIKRTEGNVDKKGKKALVLASVASMIDQFNMQNIQLLQEKGYQVDVVCNCVEGNTISDERVQDLIKRLDSIGVPVIHVPIPRKLSDVQGIKSSLRMVEKMCDENAYDLIHCQSPIGSVIARLAARKSRGRFGTKVIYTAHGFHFYNGAPKKNWVAFYPIERLCSHITDVLITINKEDYNFAKKNMKAKEVVYIPGVGVDTKKFLLESFDRDAKRQELGLEKDDIFVLSVGELNDNKNQEVVIRAISKMNNPHIRYIIAGQGDKAEYLQELACKLNVPLQLLGYRTDVVELLNAADIFAFPSFREGLSVALMEAMAAGLPCVVSRIRGNVDLIDEAGGVLCNPSSAEEFEAGLIKMLSKEAQAAAKAYNCAKMQEFDVQKVLQIMDRIYETK